MARKKSTSTCKAKIQLSASGDQLIYVGLKLPPDMVDSLDLIARQSLRTRSALMRLFIEESIKNYRLAN